MAAGAAAFAAATGLLPLNFSLATVARLTSLVLRIPIFGGTPDAQGSSAHRGLLCHEKATPNLRIHNANVGIPEMNSWVGSLLDEVSRA